MDAPTVEQKILAYGEEYLKAYNAAISTNYKLSLRMIKALKLADTFIPLYEREIGKDVAVTVAYSEWDFMLFFVNEGENSIKQAKDLSAVPQFDEEWSRSTPWRMKIEQVRDYLGLNVESIIGDPVSVPSSNFLSQGIDIVRVNGKSHGNGEGNHKGELADERLPKLRAGMKRQSKLDSFTQRYTELLSLKDGTITPQNRGDAFEILWRDALNFYGWKAKKIKISGEENDFTALHQGDHILGEVRWFADSKPMAGGKMREFLGKLDPRPRTIGFFISHSGFDKGAVSVARRSINTKTAVLFTKEEIEKVLVEQINPSDLFDEKLREVYDSVFEKSYELNEGDD